VLKRTPKNRARKWWDDLPIEKRRELKFEETIVIQPFNRLRSVQLAKVVDRYRELYMADE
jgi:hypothetical protein